MNKGKNMKKTLMMALGLAVIASAAFAEPTYSKNAVGFINKKLEKDKFYALNIQFENMDADVWVFTNMQIAADAPGNTEVYFWNSTKQAWEIGKKNNVTKKWAMPSDNYTVELGSFFFFKPGADMDMFTISGEVPDDVIPVTIAPQGNICAIGLPYPTAMEFLDTDLAKNASGGTEVYFWNTETGSWNIGKKNNVTKRWSNAEHTLEPGEGFFFKSASSDTDVRTWEEKVPYSWPNVNPVAE